MADESAPLRAMQPRISAGWGSHLRGTAGLGNWRGSRLRRVCRGIEIGTEVGKFRASFAGLGSIRGVQVAVFAIGPSGRRRKNACMKYDYFVVAGHLVLECFFVADQTTGSER